MWIIIARPYTHSITAAHFSTSLFPIPCDVLHEHQGIIKFSGNSRSSVKVKALLQTWNEIASDSLICYLVSIWKYSYTWQKHGTALCLPKMNQNPKWNHLSLRNCDLIRLLFRQSVSLYCRHLNKVIHNYIIVLYIALPRSSSVGFMIVPFAHWVSKRLRPKIIGNCN